MDVGVLRVGAELQRQVAVAELRVEGIVGKLHHALELARSVRLEPRAILEERGAERGRHGQVVRRHDRAEDAGIGRRQLGIERRRLAALGQEHEAFGEPAEQGLEIGRCTHHHVERGHHAVRRAGGHYAGPMLTVEGLALGCRNEAWRRIGDKRAIGGMGWGTGFGGLGRGERTGQRPARGGSHPEQQASAIGGQFGHCDCSRSCRSADQPMPMAPLTASRATASARKASASAFRWSAETVS